jgi:hypothetical protein
MRTVNGCAMRISNLKLQYGHIVLHDSLFIVTEK